MVKLPHASDEDIASIIAFLRSDDPMVQPAAVPSRDSEVTFLTKFLCYVAFKPFPYPKAPISPPDPSDRVAYGRYLADGLLDCYSCHSADFKTNDYFNPEKSAGFYGGGNLMLDANGLKISTANITPDPATGIGSWTEEQFLRALKAGFRPDNTPIVYPMQAYVELTDAEARAIHAYLRTVAPLVKTRLPSEARRIAQAASRGQEVYYKYRCESCHGDGGLGLCDLRQALSKYPTDEQLTAFIRNPAATVPGSKMPAWEGVIEEAEYGPLVAYVRSLQVRPTAAR
jgi:mono/diheme cytochrome c family protein